MRRVADLMVVALLAGCAGSGRYGYSRTYIPLAAERPWIERSADAVYDEVRRMPDHYQGRTIDWFGVVTSIQDAHGGPARVAMEVRTHQERHLCEDEADTTCRVTVSQRDGGPFTAAVDLRPEDAAGENRLQPGALLRVFGTLVTGEYDARGGPVLRVQYYRHWPRGEYVTTANAAGWHR